MKIKADDTPVLSEMPADFVAGASLPSTASGDMPSGAMGAGETMAAGEVLREDFSQAGEMPSEPAQAAEVISSMPLGAMSDVGGAMGEAGSSALALEMPTGLMDIAAGISQAFGNVITADGAAMELSGQWRMSLWVTPRS